MTKTVRIENADAGVKRVRITIQTKNAQGYWVSALDDQVILNHCAAITSQVIGIGKRLIIEEIE